MKSLSGPKSPLYRNRPLSHCAWLAAVSALFTSVACSDAGLDVGDDSRGVNSHEDSTTDDGESDENPGVESAGDENASDESANDEGTNPAVEMPGNVPVAPTPDAEPGNPTPMPATSVPNAPTLLPDGIQPVPMNPSPQPGPTRIPDSTCPTGLVLCGGVCVDTTSDPLNCGACSLACMTMTCEQGVCGGTQPNVGGGNGVCGDGLIDMLSESCDDGNTVSGDGCSAMCSLEEVDSECGNAILEQEACDDGNLATGDGCDDTCAIELGYVCSVAGGMPVMGSDAGAPGAPTSECEPICGDGIVAGDEECDPGMAPNETCTADCTLPI